MNKAGWNQTRRNRNIGTSKQGFGKDNELSIPQPLDTLKSFYERFEKAHIERIMVHSNEVPVIVEQLNDGYYYSCSLADIQLLLNNVPKEDLEGFGLFVFRQPKKKETILSPVWGRLIYSMEYKDEYYPSIILEAVPDNNEYCYPKKQSVEDKREFELLKQDGLKFVTKKREFVAEISKEKVRNIQLYRTLLHEIGHYVQYLEVVERPGNDSEEFEEWEKRQELYFSIPAQDKEAYANRYAVDIKDKLEEKKIIPFDRI